ncbi:hypothetical protein, partial [Chromohalobacter japonicus]
MGIMLKGHSLSAWLGRLLGEGSIDVGEVDAGKPMISRSNASLGKKVTDAVLGSMGNQESKAGSSYDVLFIDLVLLSVLIE